LRLFVWIECGGVFHCPLVVCKLTAGRQAWWESFREGQGSVSAPGELGMTAL